MLEQLFNNPELDFNLETLAQFMDKYRAKWIVAKLGGSLMDQPEAVKHILSDVAKLVNMGSYPLIVNGGGKDIDRELVKHNIITERKLGQRVTSAACAKIIDQVLFSVSERLVRDLFENTSKQAVAINGKEVFCAVPLEFFDKAGNKIELQYVGAISKVNLEPILKALTAGKTPIISSVALGADGAIYNCNADDAATAVAQALKAIYLIFLTESSGFLDEKGEHCNCLSQHQIALMMESGKLAEKILPKFGAVLNALRAGVPNVSVLDGREQNAVIQELWSAGEYNLPFATHCS